MQAVPVNVPDAFGYDGRGPGLVRWIKDSDLLFPDSHEGFSTLPGSIVGAQVHGGWVVFHGRQVIQIVPEEVHAYWHLELREPSARSNVWRIDDSAWLRSFDPTHLDGHQHFIVTLYDDVVEVICRDLLFGSGFFDLNSAIEAIPQLSYAYWRRARSKQRQGKLLEAAADFKRYIQVSPDAKSVEMARRFLDALRNKPD